MSDNALLDTLDRMPKVFFSLLTQTQPSYVRRSTRGGVATIVIAVAMLIMIWTEASSYFIGEHDVGFSVDSHISKLLQINLDITVATPCNQLSVDLRDASGDSVHFDDALIAKDNTVFRSQVKRAKHLNALDAPGQKGQVSRTNKKYSPLGPRDKHSGFDPTWPLLTVDNACRIYGSILAKKVTGNLHISAPSPLFMFGAAPRNVNMSHVVTELSFGTHFPSMAEPLDSSSEITEDPMAVYQYFLSVIPTIYHKSKTHKVHTNQYSVSDYKRNPNGPAAFPGIFFKYDIEPLTMTIHRRSMSFVAFIVRLTGVLGGVWICTNYALRVLHRLLLVVKKTPSGRRMLETLHVSSGMDTPYAQSPAQPQGQWGASSGMYDNAYGAASAPNFAMRPDSYATQRMASSGY